ncbi:MAG: archease [Candidatus Omnitrophica bacterium]|nr:archease [Candidatus Omnitrophota bacterium]MBU4149580.1 archease [Candidatus Omnitrophota bacterium]
MKPYEIIEHTADVGLRANGATLKELFQNASRGMFAIISGSGQRDNLTPGIQKTIQIKKEVEELEELLVDWLSEILYIFSKENILFKVFEVHELNNSGIKGEVYGDRIVPSRTIIQTEIKAVTFHGLRIQENVQGFSCSIIFDV